MTISNQDARTGPYNGNGSTTSFAYDFKVIDEDHLVVTLKDSSDVETVQTITTNYTVTGVGAAGGGTVEMVTAPASGETLTISRAVPLTQEVDLANRGGVQPEVLETAYDKLTQALQDQEELHARVPRFPVSSSLTNIELPLTLTANAVLKVNSAGDGFENGPTSTEISNAETNATAAASSASAASASATLASEWATKTDGQVASTDYSSKAWAIGGTGVTDTASAGAAKEWATAAEDDLVDGSEYSAKHYSAKASAQATAAANSAASAAASAQGFSGVTLLTASSNDVETTDARTYYQVDASSNTVAINLPSIGTGNDGLSYTVEVLDVSNAITLVRDGSDTINGVSGNYTGLVEVGQVIQIIADDGTPDNWIVVQTSALKVDDTTVELSGRTIQVKDNGITPAKVAGSIQDQSGTTYTLVLGDAYKTVSLDNASAVAVTVPLNSSVAFSTSDRIDFINEGAGQVTVSGASGVTINDTDGGGFTIDQYGGASIIKVGTDAWIAPNKTVS